MWHDEHDVSRATSISPAKIFRPRSADSRCAFGKGTTCVGGRIVMLKIVSAETSPIDSSSQCPSRSPSWTSSDIPKFGLLISLT